jgi:hypothetical protein
MQDTWKPQQNTDDLPPITDEEIEGGDNYGDPDIDEIGSRGYNPNLNEKELNWQNQQSALEEFPRRYKY